jgi:hypothetical protein
MAKAVFVAVVLAAAYAAYKYRDVVVAYVKGKFTK